MEPTIAHSVYLQHSAIHPDLDREDTSGSIKNTTDLNAYPWPFIYNSRLTVIGVYL